LRVIAGEAKGRRLLSVPGSGTRPITDRVKESLFAILGSAVEGATFLDLFAGTGAVGIEALSRGAAHATFVERAPKAIEVIWKNLRATGLQDRATVMEEDVFRFLHRNKDTYDIVYIAPPQYRGLWERTLRALEAAPHTVGWVAIVQIHPREFRDLPLRTLSLAQVRRYGSTQLCFYTPLQPQASEGPGHSDSC